MAGGRGASPQREVSRLIGSMGSFQQTCHWRKPVPREPVQKT